VRGLTDAEAEALVALVRDAVDARAEYTRLYAEPQPGDEAADADWHRRAGAAHEAALTAERAATRAIRGHVSG
jgi:hypothetical protein